MALKLHLLSDLHLSQAGFEAPATDADVVVLAGDIARPPEAVAWARALGKPVLYVPGNHEFYGASLAGTVAQLRALCEGTEVHLLHDTEWMHGGVRFLGTPLWTDFLLFGEGEARDSAVDAAMRFMRDFQRIRLAEDDPSLFTPQHCASLFQGHAAWLQDKLAQPFDGPTVVITHHAPSPRSIHPRFEGSPVNVCFVSHAEHLLGADKVALWLHGHTHDSFDYEVNGTRVVCNPRGYRRNEIDENAHFDPALMISIQVAPKQQLRGPQRSAVQQCRHVDQSNDSLFGAPSEESPAALAASLSPPAAPGHYDELRGGISAPLDAASAAAPGHVSPYALPTPEWARFFEHLGHEGFADLNRRTINLQRQVRDNGITYNVYADAGGPQRPWSLDLFPLIITPACWQQIEAGVLQRVQLLEKILDDVYGPQELLAANLLPPALIQGHAGYLRPMHGVQVAGGRRLHIAAFDIARDPNGAWWVVTQRTQAPSGLGYLLENRLITSRLFPEAFSELKAQRLAATYRALLESMTTLCPSAGEEPRIVLLTPGPYNETYFEHAYLARYLGLTLVEGSDLTVRDQRLYLKTLKGLEPVHGVLKRLDDEFLDPLELRADSHLGVPGLLQAVRAGNVLVANAPGSGFLESTALLGFLPALCRHLLGQELKLPALATWWCGERAAMEAVLPQVGQRVIKATYAGAGAGAVLGKTLSRRQLDEWAGRIVRDPERHTVQAYLPLSQIPTWKSARTGDPYIAPRSLILRVFAVSDGENGWRVLPGGLTRIATADTEIASMQRGGSSADTWVLTEGEVDRTSLLHHEHPSIDTPQRSRTVTSRAAENLFWLGRYTERTENTARLARLAIESLNGEDQSSQPLLAWLSEVATANALVLPAVPAATQARRVFERSLIAGLAESEDSTSVGFNLCCVRSAAAAVRERLSQEQWNLIVHADKEFQRGCAACTDEGDYASVEALRVLEVLSGHTAAMTGAQTDRMTRDDGWRLLSTGRHLERLGFLAQALLSAFETGAVFDEGGYEAVVALFDSTITFHAQYQQRHDIPALLDLLVLDGDNPRSLAWVAQTLRSRLAKLANTPSGVMPIMAMVVPDPKTWTLEALCQRDEEGGYAALMELLQQCVDAAYRLSDDLTARYFAHAGDGRYSVGA